MVYLCLVKIKKDGIKLCIYDQSGSPAAHYYYSRRGENNYEVR